MLYKLDCVNKDYSKVKKTSMKDIGWKERDLQDLLSKHIRDLLSARELMTIFNERQYQEEPDILALDKNGDLYILELKRWSAGKENLLQVLRYGQLYGSSTYDELNEMYQKYTTNKSSCLLDDHEKYFSSKQRGLLNKEGFNKQQNFLIVVNGLDQETVEAIIFWKNNGLKIDAIVYWVFEINGDKYIEFNMYSPVEGFLEYESNSYILNTNSSHDPSVTEDMLSERKAAAYYPGWREEIERLQKGDKIFLYQNKKGIIAYGEADGFLRKKEYDGIPDYEYSMCLDNFISFRDKPMSASDMRRAAKRDFWFAQTLMPIDEDARDLLIKEIKEKHL
ncbi:MAG: hypothetical protein LBE75_08490 [Burkholderiales bacterium]|jgi:hypothetical protein|nr:hypothetical protein [Burkholderiales bacterium]